MSNYTCPICDTTDPGFAWTDTHGVAQCTKCGAPVRLFFYDDNNQRTDRAPECEIYDEAVPLLRRYHAETGHKIPSYHSFPGGYDVATHFDHTAYGTWHEEHRAEFDAARDAYAERTNQPDAGSNVGEEEASNDYREHTGLG